jgi:hypothetical protein
VKRGRGGGADRRFYGLVPVLTRVSSLDGDLALAVAFDDGSHLALCPARDAGRLVRGVLDRGEEIAGSRVVAACLTFHADPGLALALAREAGADGGTDAAVADTPDLLALVMNLIEALRNHPDRAAREAVAATPATRLTCWLARTWARLLRPGHRAGYWAKREGTQAGPVAWHGSVRDSPQVIRVLLTVTMRSPDLASIAVILRTAR